MLIHKAKKEDFEEYFKLEEEYQDYNNKIVKPKIFRYCLIKKQRKQQFFKKIKERDKLFLVLEEEGKLKGFLVGGIEKMSQKGYVYKINKIGYLENVFISQKYRGQGYFSQLLKRFFAYLKRKKVSYCALHMDIANKSALKAYQKWKFKVQEYKMIAKL